MFNYLYVSTKDRKNGTHQYKLPAGEAAPTGHEITDLRVGGVYPMSELMSLEDAAALAQLFPQPGKKPRGRKGNVPWSETKAKMQRVAAASRRELARVAEEDLDEWVKPS